MSLTSTEAAETLSTSVFPLSSSPESTIGHGNLRRRMQVSESPRLIPQNGGLKPTPVPNTKHRRGELTEGNLDAHRLQELGNGSPRNDRGFESNSVHSSPAEVEVDREEVNNGKQKTTSASSKREGNPQHIVPPSHVNTLYSPDTMSHSTRAWYEFDLSVVVALASPIGKWLTGGDHVRNILLILLLIFYLHQIIESMFGQLALTISSLLTSFPVPWTLYHNSRPRRRPHPQDRPEEPHRIIAASELRFIELSFLTLTVVSPFLGALFLRYVVAAISGTDALSWFSTGLFVLATGMRPWRHLVERFHSRTHELHNVIHYPPTPDKLQSELEEMNERVSRLEKSLASLRVRLADTTEDVYEYVDDAVDALQTSSKKFEKKCEKNESRLKDVEDSVAGLRKGKEKDKRLSVNTTNLAARPSMALISSFPSWLGLGLLPSSRTPHRPRYPSQSGTSKHALRTFPSSSSMRLESIPEEDTKPVADSRSFRLQIPGARLVLRWGDLATLPLRRVVHYLLT
jgi:hypothetical protein